MSLFIFDLEALDAEPMVVMLNVLHQAGHDIQVWTRRGEEEMDQHRSWLSDRGVPPALLTNARPAGWGVSDENLKMVWLGKLEEKPMAVFDDIASTMWRRDAGLPCFNLAPHDTTAWCFDLAEAEEAKEYLLAGLGLQGGQCVVLARLHWFEEDKTTKVLGWQSTLTGERLIWLSPYAFAERPAPPDPEG